MNETITSREELLLAKIAGHDVDLRTMTPPVASNLTEKLMLEIADRLDGMGGTGDTYKSVFEMEVGTMEESEMGSLSPVYFYAKQIESMPDLPLNLYLNSEKYPLTKLEVENAVMYLYNLDPTSGEKKRDEEPLYIVMFGETGQSIQFISDTPDLSNTTIKLLQKVGDEPSGGSDRLVVTLEYVEYEDGGETRHKWQSDKSYTEIKAALDAKRGVEVLYPYDFDGALTDPMFIHLYPLGSQAINESVSLIGFASMPTFSGIGFSSASVTCQYNSTTDATTWNVAWNGIAQSKEFAFTATPDGQGGFTVTPGDGVTYVAILNAMASSPLVFAIVSVPALNNTVIAQFNAKSSVSGNGVVAASIVGYFNSAYSIMELYMRSDGTSGVNVVPIPTQS